MEVLKEKLEFLVVDPNNARRLQFINFLQQWFPKSHVKGIKKGSRALLTMRAQAYDLLFVPWDLEDIGCENLLREIKDAPYICPVVLLIDKKLPRTLIDLLELGVYGVVRLTELDGYYPLFIILSTLKRKTYQDRLIEIQQSLKEQSIKDDVTCIYNHRFLRECLEREFEESRRYNRPMSVFMLDIDDFKDVNDKYGHIFGDFVLHGVGQLLSRITRKSDIVARYGGEEFAIILPNTPLQNAYHSGIRLCRSMARHRFKRGRINIKLTISIGAVSSSYNRVKKAQDLLRFADRALYSAKKMGKNTIQLYPPEENDMATIQEDRYVPEKSFRSTASDTKENQEARF